MVQTHDCIAIPLPHYLIQFTFCVHSGHVQKPPRSDTYQRYQVTSAFASMYNPPLRANKSSNGDSSQFSRDGDDVLTEKPAKIMSFGHSCNSCKNDCQDSKRVLLNLIDSIPSVLKMVDSQGCTLLHYLALSQCPLLDEIATRIFELNVIDHMAVDKFGNSSLHFACMSKNEPMIFKLLHQKKWISALA